MSVYVRVWRDYKRKLSRVQTFPEEGFWDTDWRGAVVFDLKLQGKIDKPEAHYTLLPSGSLLNK